MPHKAPQKLNELATKITADVDPIIVIILPIHMDKINCAKNTMLETIAISVPSPRIPLALFPPNYIFLITKAFQCSYL